MSIQIKGIIKDKTLFDQVVHQENYITVYGAKENNLKNIDVSFPRNALVVITGVSGSGKSSLAFDTIYAEGQRRYMDSLSTYVRSFIGNIKRPDVDKIEGLSPVISIEQKVISHNPRSTVGTSTEIYDFMRLLFTHIGEAYSFISSEKMIQKSEEQIQNFLLEKYSTEKLIILAPVIKGRKGYHKDLFTQIRRLGFFKVRVDGEIREIDSNIQLDRYKKHHIEILIDRLTIEKKNEKRLACSLKTAMKYGKGVVLVLFPKKIDLKGKSIYRYFSKFLTCPTSGLAYDNPTPSTFSFNSPQGACPECKGLGTIESIHVESIIPNPDLTIKDGGIVPLGKYRDIWIFKAMHYILEKSNFSLSTQIKKIPKEIIHILLYGVQEEIETELKICESQKKNTFISYRGIIPFLEEQRSYGSENIKKWITNFSYRKSCTVCKGDRLKRDALYFKIRGKNIAELAKLTLKDLRKWFENLESHLSKKEKQIAEPILEEIKKRLSLLHKMRLDYLTLNRKLNSLSGGESQRIRITTQIGTQLTGVLYILDEPSIGLHHRDNIKLIKALKELRDLGNSIIVVEHDKDIMLHSDYIVDIGPGAGLQGGEVVAEGKPNVFLKKRTPTADFLSGKAKTFVPSIRRSIMREKIILEGARGHNLKNITVSFPLGTMICITGVSGSGKSTLIHGTLLSLLNKYIYGNQKRALPYERISGIEYIDKVIEIDQAFIGKTPRSNPATYTGIFTEIRSLFCNLPESKIRGYTSGRFSFNVKGGRCEACEGYGKRLIRMDFLPGVYVECEVCKGKRYNSETLEVRLKRKSIADILDMSVLEASSFFKNFPNIFRKIKLLDKVGLGYLTLGQCATTLSGGESQRVKLSAELSKRDTRRTFYILDEPTTGLHFQDIQHLLYVLHKLVEKNNTVLIIEHNIEIIRSADYIIDMGPEGGKGGGEIIYSGTPEQVAKNAQGHTAHFLRQEL